MRTRKPTHPGAILSEDVLPELGMSVSAFARNLGVSRQTLHAVLAERSGVPQKWRYVWAHCRAMACNCGWTCKRNTIYEWQSKSCMMCR